MATFIRKNSGDSMEKKKSSPVTSNKKKVTVKKPKITKDSPMTRNMKLFADRWLVDRNATKAYKIAFPNTKNDQSAGAQGCVMLKDPRVQKHIKEKMANIAKKIDIDIEWVLRRFKLLVDYNVDDFFDEDGNVRPLEQISPDKLYAVCGLKSVTTITNKKKKQIKRTIIKDLKFPDKKGVLDSLAKYLGMFAEDNKQKVATVPEVLNIRLVD